MEENRDIRRDVMMSRIRIIGCVMLAIVIGAVVRLGCIQWGSPATAYNSERVHRSIRSSSTQKAHQGSILARDGRPLATTITRLRVYVDFASQGFDNEERFEDESSILSHQLAAYFGDKSAAEYKKLMKSERSRSRQILSTRFEAVRRGGNIFARLVDRLNGDLYDTIRHDSIKRIHTRTRLFGDVSPDEWQRLRKMSILNGNCGLVLVIDTLNERLYPHGELAKRTIGRSSTAGRYGLEHAYRSTLAGEDGIEWRRNVAPGFYVREEEMEYREAVDGMDIVTTIDTDLQDIADKALRAQILKENARWGTTIVMDCATGDILCMANIGRAKDGSLAENFNYAIGTRFEPGSTFKLAVLLSLLDDANVSPSKCYDSGHGKVVVVGEGKLSRKVQDSHDVDDERNEKGVYITYRGKRVSVPVDMRRAFRESANVYFAKAVHDAYHENPGRFATYLRDSLHLHGTMWVDSLHGKESLISTLPNDKAHLTGTIVQLISMGYGYGVELTPMHTLMLYNAIANNGRMVAPRIIKRYERSGETIAENPVRVISEKICSDRTLALARSYMEDVALGGTARSYFGENKTPYRVGAKTGTAQFQQGDIKYADGYYIGSMVAILPADNPRYTILTCIYTKRQKDKKYYGADLAGPVERQIATYLYNRGNNWSGRTIGAKDLHPVAIKGGDIPSIRGVAEALSMRTSSDSRTGWGRVDVSPSGQVDITSLSVETRTMPDVIGMGLSDALFVLESMGLSVSFEGEGGVCEQSIPAGTSIVAGDRVKLKLKI